MNRYQILSALGLEGMAKETAYVASNNKAYLIFCPGSEMAQSNS